MPPYLFNLIPEHQTPYGSCLEVYTVFYDNSGFGPKSDPRLSNMAHTHKLPKHDTTKHRYDLLKTQTETKHMTRQTKMKKRK